MVDKLFEDLCALDEVEALALGGSRAGERFDEASDYDVYLYCRGPVPAEARRAILSRYCSIMEIGNHFEENLEKLFQALYHAPERVAADIQAIIRELERICGRQHKTRSSAEDGYDAGQSPP